MSRDKIIELLKAHYEELTGRFGIKSLAIFGSAARDESGPESDMDVLVDFAHPPTFDQYMDLKFFLEDFEYRGLLFKRAFGIRLHDFDQ